MKSETEIAKAHDILAAIVLGEVPPVVRNKEAMKIALDVLCWALEHEHNTAFGDNLAAIEAELTKRGFVLTRKNN